MVGPQTNEKSDASAPGPSEGTLSQPNEAIRVQKSALNQGINIILFILTALLMVWASRELPWSVQTIKTPGLILGYQISVRVPLFGLIPLMLLCRVAHELLNYKYFFTDEYVLVKEGYLSFSSKTRRLLYIHIKSVEIDRNLYQRLVNLGDLRISGDPSNPHADVVLVGLRDPHRYKDILQERIFKAVGRANFPSIVDS